MRVYIPITLPGLAKVRAQGGFGEGPLAAHAVTPALREWYVSDDIEELEYAAMTRAAQGALALLAVDQGAARRRVVVAVDVSDDGRVRPDRETGLSAVRVEGEVRLADAAAVHVDEVEAEADVAAAAGMAAAAAAGDDDARFVVDGAEAHELLWFAMQELDGLLDGSR